MHKSEQPTAWKPWIRALIFAALLASLTGGAYLVFRRLMADRQSMMNYRLRPEITRRNETPKNGREVKTYSGKELEEARRKGQLPAGAATAAQAAQPNNPDAQIQRTLRTIDEINRINEMNRRMMEQQQRMQRQQQQK